ncbi:orotidine-5'-phosphate decarboxylase [Sphingomonas hankyongi]|uniref:Orotidine 5'-phosphate decarboxylase n=1 Tax=Sphingomonas hankyongi TaxID=2908209 RepID=A0ABT0RZ19_9SPHN|nr:orotidine-5'-phosphate decarboxylase [Sphingomonas hankyongi]MCL6728689.1 orotidine-5'-phosphate decarboxylase [Sphingomonas hankyongi]
MNPIFVAIDTPDVHRAAALARDLRGLAGGVKLGLEFFCANGEDGVLRIAEGQLPVFLDLKFHDIPNTVGKAVAAIAHLQPAVLTVHAAGGREMMAAAKAAAPPQTKVVGVTVLTSLDQSDLAATGITGAPDEQVRRLTDLAREAGIDGIVCSGAEVAAAKKAWPDGFFVVPGVRPAGADVGDQKRVATPREALNDGASILVIGRPITDAANPAGAMREIAASLNAEEARYIA